MEMELNLQTYGGIILAKKKSKIQTDETSSL